MIRLARAGDAEAIARIYAPFVRDTAVTFEVEPAPDAEEFAARIGNGTYPYLVDESEGELTGFAYAGKHHDRAAYQWSTNVGLYLDPRFHRRGIGRALYSELFSVLRRQGFVNAIAGIAIPNDASIAFHEAMGFARAAYYRNIGYKLGAWRDVGWWQLELQPPVAEPAPRVAIRDLK